MTDRMKRIPRTAGRPLGLPAIASLISSETPPEA